MEKLLNAILKTTLTFVGTFILLFLVYLLYCFVAMEWIEIPTETNFSIGTLLRALTLVFALGVVLFYFAEKE